MEKDFENLCYHNKLMIVNAINENRQYQTLCEILKGGVYSEEHARIVRCLLDSLSKISTTAATTS